MICLMPCGFTGIYHTGTGFFGPGTGKSDLSAARDESFMRKSRGQKFGLHAIRHLAASILATCR